MSNVKALAAQVGCACLISYRTHKKRDVASENLATSLFVLDGIPSVLLRKSGLLCYLFKKTAPFVHPTRA